MSNVTPKISIVVPVFNAGQRFIKCMDTLVNQTLREIEIILVLDCPTDGTDKIAKEYASKDGRILIIENKTNLHIGNSRNEGLKIAKGEYIGFSDHDDYRELTMYEELYKVAKQKDFEIVLGTNNYFNPEITITPIENDLTGQDLRKFILSDLILDGNEKYLIPIATNVHPNIYKTSFLIENNLLFADTNMFSPEDRIFQIMCIVSSQNITFVKEKFYYHLLHSQSAVHEKQYKSCKTRANGKRLIYDYLIKKNCYDEYSVFFLESVKKEFTDCLLNAFYSDKDIVTFLKNRKFLKSFPFTKEAFQKAKYSVKKYRLGGKISRRIVFLLMNL